jgi:exonuclease III
MACDFFFVSSELKDKLRDMRIDGQTQASDHQPMLLELA